MRLLELRCKDFRCLQDLHFIPGPDVNVIHGLNGHGKTSVLEAVHYAATSKSHRTIHEAELARRGAEGFRVVIKAQRNGGERTIEANWHRGLKRIKVNGVAQTRLSDMLGLVSVVMYSPEDLALVKGTASQRRRFLDMELSQLRPPYLYALQEYRKLLRQRNELLRAEKPDKDLLEVWDEQLARYGERLITDRQWFIDTLTPLARTAYAKIAENERFALNYAADVAEPSSLHDVIASSRDKDLRRQMTTRGPHRDDVSFEVGEVSARSHASQGQQKSVALSIKLAELEVIRESGGSYPILLVDDALSELDEGRTERLVRAVPSGVQSIFTTAVDSFRRLFEGKTISVFEMRNGAMDAN